MKFERASLKPFLVELTEKARQEYAASALDLETVRQVMTAAAKAGRAAVRIPLTVDVHGTDAAAKLEQWAVKEGLILSWEGRQVGTPDGPRDVISEPELRWISSPVR
jgi:hypothetical protein